MTYTCPVCGYNKLHHPPEDWLICPCCLTEFGYSDVNWGVEELRREWIASGAEWGSKATPQPIGYNPESQLRNIGYELTDADCEAIALTKSATARKFVLSAPQAQWIVTKIEGKTTTQTRNVQLLRTGNLSFFSPAPSIQPQPAATRP